MQLIEVMNGMLGQKGKRDLVCRDEMRVICNGRCDVNPTKSTKQLISVSLMACNLKANKIEEAALND